MKWKEKIGEGTMALVDGCLLCLTYGGDLLLVEPHPEGFKELAEMKHAIALEDWENHRAGRLNDPAQFKGTTGGFGFAPCWSARTVARGKVYLHDSDRLVCYDLMEAGRRELAAPAEAGHGRGGQLAGSHCGPRAAGQSPQGHEHRRRRNRQSACDTDRFHRCARAARLDEELAAVPRAVGRWPRCR